MEYVLVLGGNGFIGLNIVQEYKNHEKNIIIYGKDANKSTFISLLSEDIIIYDGLLSDYELLAKNI